MNKDQLKKIITEEDLWTGGEGENEEGLPFLLRYRNNLQHFVETGNYNTGLIILWNYTSEDDSLMAGTEEMGLMQKVEDTLVAALEDDLQAVLAFVFTGLNQREWHWYTTDPEESGKRINDALAEFDELPIELSAEEDPEWTEYYAIMDGATSEEGSEEGTEEEEEN